MFCFLQRVSFVVLSSLTSILMLVVVLIIVFIQFYYYDVIDFEPIETFDFIRKEDVLKVLYSLKIVRSFRCMHVEQQVRFFRTTPTS